jgi:predicted nucleic acid-binding protein
MILLDTTICIAAQERASRAFADGSSRRPPVLAFQQALVEDALLISNNTREFARVPDLRLQNWLAP